jgi:hypothetical protein
MAPVNRRRTLLTLLMAALASPLARAGAPYFTDDPEPVDYQHYEVYLASQLVRVPGDSSGTVFSYEINYGIAPDVHIHFVAPAFFDEPSGQGLKVGYGDTELGIKYRFIDENADHPQFAVYPTVEIPTGDGARGLGTGHAQLYLPLWLQKSVGDWTTYGGGGYWINPGAGNRNWVFLGWMVQRQVLPNLAIGIEVFHETPMVTGSASDTRANLGVVWDLSETSHVLASAGPVISGPSGYQAYIGFQITPGAKK